jgi:hypothetical protein
MEAWLVDDELDDGELDVEVCAAGEVVVFAVAVAVEVGVGLDEAGSPADVEVAAARAGSVDGWVHPAMTTKTTARATPAAEGDRITCSGEGARIRS